SARFTGDPEADVSGDPPVSEVDRARSLAGLASLPSSQASDAGVGAADAETELARAGRID
ncbi:hypothetical protein OY671_011935, partial [Metschnikowia pulcherrima]